MIAKKYNALYAKHISQINIPLNTITKIFLSKFSPLKKNFKKKKILDFSCGSGPYLDFFSSLGFKVYATEISEVIVNQLKNKYPKIHFKIAKNNQMNFPNNFFKFFISIHSIYYLDDELSSFDDTVKLVKSKIEKNGYFIFTIPKLSQKHLKFKRVNKNLYKIIRDKYNLRKNSYFHLFKNENEIKKYFNKYFKIIEIGTVFGNFKNLEENYFLCVMQKK